MHTSPWPLVLALLAASGGTRSPATDAPLSDTVGTCTMVGGIGIPADESVRIRVYQENRRGGNGPVIATFSMRRGDRRNISAPTTRIRYEYMYLEDDDFHTNTGAWCQDRDDVINVP